MKERNMIVRTHVRRYGDAKFGDDILWAAAVIREFWVAINPRKYPGLERRTFECVAAEANFATKRAAENWAAREAAKIRGL